MPMLPEVTVGAKVHSPSYGAGVVTDVFPLNGTFYVAFSKRVGNREVCTEMGYCLRTHASLLSMYGDPELSFN